MSTPPRITVPLAGRLIVRMPFVADMRTRLARCGGTPQWEADKGVWTLPRTTLEDVVTEVSAVFSRVAVAIEVGGDERSESSWLRYELDSERPQDTAARARLIGSARAV